MSFNNTTATVGKSAEETLIVISLSTLAFGLAPLTLASNILVIVPFCRFSRVRTASNQILLALAITDLLLGMSLCMASIAGLTKVTNLVEVNNYLHLSYAVALAMATLQATSLMLMMANSVDKALSLLRPLHYNEIMTFTTVKVYIAFTVIVASMVGVVVPLASENAWSGDVPIIPFGPENKELLRNLMAFFTLPCGLIVTFCHIYVYSVANRHAKAIKRDGHHGVRDRMKMSEAAHYMMPQNTSEAVVTVGTEAAKPGNYLTIPIPLGINGNGAVHSTATAATTLPNCNTQLPSKLNNGISSPKKEASCGGGEQYRGHDDHVNNQSNSYSNAAASASTHRYGASLLLGVLVVFISRVPSQVWCFLFDQTRNNPAEDVQKQLFYIFANIPLFLCSALNPWMYAYHNLEMKPIMKRLLKRVCRRVLRPQGAFHSHPQNEGQSQPYRSSGFMTNWQVSVFATFPRQSSCQHIRSASSCGGGLSGVQGAGSIGGAGGLGKISTSPSLQQPQLSAFTKLSPSQSQTSALSRSISQMDYHWQNIQQDQPRQLQRRPQQPQQPRTTFSSFVNYNHSKSYYTSSTTTSAAWTKNAAASSAAAVRQQPPMAASTQSTFVTNTKTVIPTVTVWDGDSTRLTKPEDML